MSRVARTPNPAVKASLESSPAELHHHEYAWATYRLRNTANEPTPVYFVPTPNSTPLNTSATGSHFTIEITLLEPKNLNRHDVESWNVFEVPEGPPKLARVTIDPGGMAWFQHSWCARRSMGGRRLTPPDIVPLAPGAYVLEAQTPNARLDRQAPIRIVPGGDRVAGCHWPGQSDSLNWNEHQTPAPAPSP